MTLEDLSKEFKKLMDEYAIKLSKKSDNELINDYVDDVFKYSRLEDIKSDLNSFLRNLKADYRGELNTRLINTALSFIEIMTKKDKEDVKALLKHCFTNLDENRR